MSRSIDVGSGRIEIDTHVGTCLPMAGSLLRAPGRRRPRRRTRSHQGTRPRDPPAHAAPQKSHPTFRTRTADMGTAAADFSRTPRSIPGQRLALLRRPLEPLPVSSAGRGMVVRAGVDGDREEAAHRTRSRRFASVPMGSTWRLDGLGFDARARGRGRDVVRRFDERRLSTAALRLAAVRLAAIRSTRGVRTRSRGRSWRHRASGASSRSRSTLGRSREHR